ncbi:restriction endonuclease subunit S [Xanthobacter autotrophicus]|uniref:restriction endonuclease subunit S n=1 Tax=Xanthobacter autotrophicus TaxID=280 RepID=UPI003727920B
MSREVPSGWASATIGQVAAINLESVPANTPADFLLRYIDVATVEGPSTMHEPRLITFGEAPSRARRKVTQGDILVSTVRPYLRAFCKVASEEENLVASTAFAVLHPQLNINGDFLYQHILSDPFIEHLTPRMKGSNYPAVTASDVSAYSFSLPPLPEQRRIAEILSSVDEAIAATRAVIEQTRKVKQAVLERLLTKGIGHTRFKQTEIGEIPEGWDAGRIDDFFVLQRGFDLTERQSAPGNVPVISSSGTSYFHSTSMIPGPAVITGRKGKLGQVHFIDQPCWPHDTTLWVKDFKGNEPRYVYWFLRSLSLEKFDAATAVPTLNRNVVHAQNCAFPPRQEQSLIAKSLDGFESAEILQIKLLAQYGALKSALMSDLLTGRKRVTDALPLAAE